VSSRDTQKRIKQAAVKLFNDRGTSKVSTNTIAEHCAISKGNLHYHFKNKQEVIKAIYVDIAAEIEADWNNDAEAALAKTDPELGASIVINREKRISLLVHFFETLIESGVLKKTRSRESLRYLVIMTWIFTDNWLNFMELQGSQEHEEVAQLGYDMIIEILYPYLTEKATEEIYDSYAAITLRLDH